MDYTELLPPLPEPVDFCVDKDSHLYDTYTADQLRAAQLAAIAAAAPAIRKAERETNALTIDLLRFSLDAALGMLADWCVAVDVNGTGWDDWDEHYKDAMYRPGPLRDMLDKAIAESRSNRALPEEP